MAGAVLRVEFSVDDGEDEQEAMHIIFLYVLGIRCCI